MFQVVLCHVSVTKEGMIRKMKLLFAHNHRFHIYKENYYSNGSFSSEALLRYTNAFKEVTFVSRQVSVDSEPKNMSLVTTNGINYIKIPDFESIRKYYKKIEAHKIIKREIQEMDFIIARLPSSIGAIAVKYAIKYNKPYLVEVVTCPWDSFWNHSWKGKIIAPFHYYSSKKLILNAPYVVYVTNKFLQKRYPTMGKQINCSNVALKDFGDVVMEKRLFKIQNKKKDSKLIIGTIAAVDVRFKGQQYVIEALGKLKVQGFNDYEYQLVGGGDQSYLKSIAKKYDVAEKIHFMNYIPHNEIFSWLEDIDIYVQPSRQEGLPRALIEAMSRGLPALGARTAGIPELLDNQYIFSNTKRNIDEICTIFKQFTKETMAQQGIRNFEESKKYKREIIEKRRTEFFNDFKNSVNKS